MITYLVIQLKTGVEEIQLPFDVTEQIAVLNELVPLAKAQDDFVSWKVEQR